MPKKIYGYYFTIIVEKTKEGYVAYAPGVGGVYEEGQTFKEAEANAYEAACAILEARLERGDPLTEENEYLKIITEPPDRESIDEIPMEDGYIITTPPCAIPA